MHGEDGTAWVAHKFDRPTCPIDDLAADIETESCPLASWLAGHVRVKDLIEQLRRYSRSVVAERNLDLTFCGSGIDAKLALAIECIDSIADQVSPDLGQVPRDQLLSGACVEVDRKIELSQFVSEEALGSSQALGKGYRFTRRLLVSR